MPTPFIVEEQEQHDLDQDHNTSSNTFEMSCTDDQGHQHSQDTSQLSQPPGNLPSVVECRASGKCCTQACFLREEQQARELQKLRESYVALKLETDKEIAFLKQQLASATSTSVDTSASTCSTIPTSSAFTALSTHTLVPTVYSITDSGVKPSGRIDRLGSIKSAQVLALLRPPPVSATARRVLSALADPMMTTQPYLRSLQFAADLVELSAQVSTLLEREARCLDLPSPVYVFGDVHGNWSDLRFFAEHMWHLGLELTAGSFLFLGDYVDRGSSSLECTAYLFAHKLLYPDKLFLLRGNHETRAVNGLEAHYGSSCLLAQCKARFGASEGGVVWHQLNNAFDRLPLSAVIDNDVFCVHGGIPRPIEDSEDLLETIATLPAAASLDTLDTAYYADKPQLLVIADMIWGDPVRNEEALEQNEAASGWRLNSRGFGKSPRGGVAVRFGSRAIDAFLEQYGFSRILRAHEANREGLSFSNAARVITVFSTSKDHGMGDDATCGCVLVDNQQLRFFNRARSAGRNLRQQVSRRHNRVSGTPWISRLPNALSQQMFMVPSAATERSVGNAHVRSIGGDDSDDEDEQQSDHGAVVRCPVGSLRISNLALDARAANDFTSCTEDNNNQDDDD